MNIVTSLFNRFSIRQSRKAGFTSNARSVPEGVRIYVIGDVHGRADLLETLSQHIETDKRGAAIECTAVFLGDFIDRGTESAAVLERLSKGAFPTPVIALRGNHEQTMLDAFEDQNVFQSWRQFGGLETLMSYGVDVSQVMRGHGYGEASRQMADKLPQAHRQFVESMPLTHEVGDYFFCHAGVRPGIALARQSAADLLWIRQEFLNSHADHGKMVVHGHSPVSQPEVYANRINIDTGAYATGVLTCLVLEGSTRRFLST